MRSAVALAAFAAGALAVPFGHRHQHRDTVATDIDVVYKTDIVTVTANGPAPTAVSVPAKSTPSSTHVKVSEHDNWSNHEVQPAPVASSADAPSVVVVTIVPSSTYVPPPAAPTPTVVVESSPAPQPAATEPAATGSSGATPTTYDEIVVYHHNLHRRNHSAPDIVWSDTLAASAAIVASSCLFEHSMNVNGGGYGQNIAAGVDSANISSVITDLFYNGEVGWFDGLYGQANPDMTNFLYWGHFSQLVWKGTTAVGCATQTCSNGVGNTGSDVDPYFTVCNYAAEGNMGGEYGANIGEPLGMPTAQWNTGL